MSSWSGVLRVLVVGVVWLWLGGDVAAQGPSDAFGRPLVGDGGLLWYRGADPEALIRDAAGAHLRAGAHREHRSQASVPDPGHRDGDFVFGPWTSHHPGSWPDAVAIGDVTGDGRPDVVLTTTFYFDPTNDYHVFVYPQLPDGTLGPPTGYPYLATAFANGILLVDLDEDQVLDVVVGHGSGISVLLANGVGGLLPAALVAGQATSSLSTMDVDLDQHADVLALHGDATLTVFLGDGGGGFAGLQSVAAGDPTSADHELGDLDGDGFQDLAVVSGQAVLTVTHHDQVSGFLSGWDSYPMGGMESCDGLGVGDVTGDGLDDTVLGRPYNSPTHLWIMTQVGTGGLSGPTTIATYDVPEPVAVADLDGDGLEDVVVLHAGWVQAGVYLQGPSGLAPEQLYQIPYASHYATQGLALGDVSSDGCTDLAIADYNYGLVVLHGSGCVQTIFADDFESGGTGAWSLTVP